MPSFEGWTASDFEAFSIPDFPGRMAVIRSQLRPKLIALGEDLAEPVGEIVSDEIYSQAAQHMRRRVNPPVATWVAFGRDKRGYKRWVHYRISIGLGGASAEVFVEDDADDKPALSTGLRFQAAELLDALAVEPEARVTTVEGAPLISSLGAGGLVRIGDALAKTKLLKFTAGVQLSPADAVHLGADGFRAWALQKLAGLRPLYLISVSDAMSGR